MVFVRQSLVKDASNYLSRAVTIAVRYSAVRRQFSSSEDKPETQVQSSVPAFIQLSIWKRATHDLLVILICEISIMALDVAGDRLSNTTE